MQELVVKGSLPSLNEYTRSCRSNPFMGNKMKKNAQEIIGWEIKRTKLKPVEDYPCSISIKWYEKNHRRDIDNIIFGQKFILDSLVEQGVLIDDSQKYINEINHQVFVDKNNPRIEICIE